MHSREKSVIQWKTNVYIQPSLLTYLILAGSAATIFYNLVKLQVSITMKSYFYGPENSILVENQLSSFPPTLEGGKTSSASFAYSFQYS